MSRDNLALAAADVRQAEAAVRASSTAVERAAEAVTVAMAAAVRATEVAAAAWRELDRALRVERDVKAGES